MSRLHKKCLLASTAMHALLVGIIVFGAAFLTPSAKDKRLDIQPLTFIQVPDRLIDANLSGGGSPTAPPPVVERTEPTPPTPAPAPEVRVPEPTPPPVRPVETPRVVETPTPPPAREPEPEPVRPPQPSLEAAKTKAKAKDTKAKDLASAKTAPATTNTIRTLPKVDLSKTVRLDDGEKARQREAAQQQAARQKRIGDLAGRVRERASGGGITIESFGPGTGGETYANYAQWVFTEFDRAWTRPRDVGDGTVVQTTVVINRDGRVKSARITSGSGNAAMDKSVQRALDRVTKLPPFPEGATDLERSFDIEFMLKSTRSTG